MQQNGVVPNVFNYNALISGYEADKQPEQTLQAFEAMQWQGEVPDQKTYSALMSACAKGKLLLEHTLEAFHHL